MHREQMVMNHQMLYFSVILNHLKPVVTCDSYMPWKQKVTNLSSILFSIIIIICNVLMHVIQHVTNPSPSVILI